MAALCRICGADTLARRSEFSPQRPGDRTRLAFFIWLILCGSGSTLSVWATPPQITVQPQNRTVVEGASYTFLVTATGSSPLSYQWRKDNSDLGGKTASSLPLSAITTNDAGRYTVVVTNVDGAVTSAPARLTVRLASDPVYPVPQGGWAYLFQGDAAAGSLTAALDGTWDHSTDNWAGDGRGAAVPPAGGIDVTNGILTIEDATASGSGFNNRRIYLTHNLTNEPTVTNATTLLNDGVTMTFRARLTPPTDPLLELSGVPSGLINNSDGKGMIGLRQAGAGGMILGFSLHQAVEDLNTTTTFSFAQAGLHMNNLNGDVRASAVDPGEGGITNILALDPSVFHEFWITVQDNGAETGTHRVSIYLDGGLSPTVFNVTAGVGSDGPATNYLAVGLGSSAQRGAFDLDFLGYRPGVVVPSAFNQPLSFTALPADAFVAPGQSAAFTVGVSGTPPYVFQWFRAGSPLSGATNATYVTAPVVPADEGARFTVVVTADSSSITSSPPALLHLLTVPIISAQPQSLTVTNGDTVTFRVTATSPTTPTYRWRQNGNQLNDQTNATLTIPNAGPGQAGNYDVVVANASGSVTSAVATLIVVLFDFGDAPGYPTLKGEDGARHRIVPGVRLGALIDGELDGLPDLAANGDDADGSDDEDGVTWLGPLRIGLPVGVQVVASTNGNLNAWIDFDRNGSWAEPGEQVFTNRALVAGTNTLSINVPANAVLGNSYARFRFSTASGASFSGPASDGEVEDYAVAILAVTDLAATVTDAPDPVAASSNLVYTITVTNAGPSLAADVALTDVLPAGVAFISALPSQGSCAENGGTVSCGFGAMAKGTVVNVALVVAPGSARTLTNSVTVSGADFDSVPTNNTAIAVTAVLNAPSIASQPPSQTVTNGGVANLSVAAAGTVPLAYQWEFGGLALSGATNSSLVLSNVQLSSSGTYTVRITNLVGGVVSQPAVLTVLVPPSIVTPPQSRTNLAGGNVAFTVVAAGTAPLGYQWYFNATNSIPGATDQTLTLVKVDLTQAGTYRVVVTNVAGVLTSAVATLTLIAMDFGDAPAGYPVLLADDGARHRLVPGVRLGATADFEPDAITDPPALGDDLTGVDDDDGVFFNTAVRPGQLVSASVIASTNGVLNAWLDFGRDGSWAEPGDQIVTNKNLTTGTNTVTFLVPAGANVGFTYARFRFSTQAGLSYNGEAANGEVEDYEVNIESVADLAIAKMDTLDPVAVGSNAVYQIVLTNAGPALATGVTLSDTLPAGATFVSASSSQGACNASAGLVVCSLGLLSPNSSTAVTLTVVPTAEGSMTNSVTVGANEPDLNLLNNSLKKTIAVLAPPQIIAQPQSQTVSNGGTVTLSVSATGSGLRYQWRKDAVDLPGATNSVFVMSNVQLANEGLYTVRISNAVGSVISSAASVSVPVTLVITTQPQSQTVNVGATATFRVSVTGSRPVTYRWDQDAIEIPGESSSNLVLSAVQTNQAGGYRVRISNPLGSVTSVVATLTVVMPPVFVQQPQSRTNFAGSTAVFDAVVEGTQPLGYQWFFAQTNRLVNQTNATLTLLNVQSAQAGNYTLLASNVGGQATSAVASLTVFEVDFGDAPESLGYPTTLAFNGARHRIVPGVRLGLLLDSETDGLPNANATGDDNGGVDDEDGIIFPSTLVLGQMVNIQVVASTNGFLSGWIDFNANGTWAEPTEQVARNVPLVAGTNLVPISISALAVTGNTFARFRFSTVPDLSFDGLAPDGEVEDYLLTIQPGADLTALVVHSPDPVPVGSNVTFTVVVTNQGPAAATGVVVSNTVATIMTVLTATPSQGSCNNVNDRIVCNIGNLPKNSGATITLIARANAAGTALSTVRVSANEGDVNPLDNLVTHTTPCVVPGVPFSNPSSLTIADASTTQVGISTPYPSTITVSGLTGALYSVTATLNGVSHGFASDLDVLLVGPDGQGVLLMSDCGGSAVISGVTLTFDDNANLPLPSGGAIVPGTYRPTNYDQADSFPPPAPVGPYAPKLATFAGINPNGIWSLYVVDDFSSDTGTINNGWRLNITTVDPIADLAVSGVDLPDAVAVDSSLAYNITIRNLGPAAASGVRVTNALPAGMAFVSASTPQGSCSQQGGIVTCDLGSIAPSATAVATITVTPTVAGALTTAISVGGSTVDFVPGNNLLVAATTARPATDLFLTQSVSTNQALLGQPLTYTLNLTNRGPNRANNVRLSDPLPVNASFVSATSTQGACSNVGGTVLCDFGGLAVNAGARVTIVATAAATGNLTNTATVASDEFDSFPTNNVASVVTTVGFVADLAVSILAIPDPVPSGAALTYTAVVTNLGPLPATSVQLTNPVPSGATFVGAVPSQGTCDNAGGLVRCDLGTLANGAQATVLLTLVPTSLGRLTNVAGVTTVSVDQVPGNNAASRATTVQAPPAILSAPQNQTVLSGSNFSLTVSATGTAPLFYQWQFNNTDLNGATAQTLTLSNVSAAATGPYRVRVSNAVGAAISAVATVTVLVPPVISHILDQQIDEDTPTAALALTVGDANSPAAGLELTAGSSNLGLVPVTNIVFGGSASNRTVRITPSRDQSGLTTITLQVRDNDNLIATDSFVVTVRPVNDPPTISDIPDRSSPEDNPVVIAVTVGDVDDLASDLVITATSSDSAVVPTTNLLVDGTGTNRTLTLFPVTNAFGACTITVTVKDTNGAAASDAFRLTIEPVNDPPTLGPLRDLSLAPGAGPQVVSLSNITAGAANEIQTLVVTAVASDPLIVSNITVDYTSPASIGTLRFTPARGIDASTTVTVTVNDGGSINPTTARTFEVTVSSTNSPPVLRNISDQVTAEDTVLDIPIFLSDSNTPLAKLTVTVSSSNTNLVPATNVTVLGNGADRILRILPATNQSGTATMTVTVSDPPGAFDTKTFQLIVLPVIDPPTIDLPAEITGNEDQPFAPIQLQLIAPDTDPAALTVTAISLNTNLILNTGLALSGTGATRSLRITPAPDQFGSGFVVLTVADANGLATDQSLLVKVNAVNDPPTLAPVPDLTLPEDNGPVVVPLSGISPGPANEIQPLTITAVSANQALIPNPVVSYLHPQTVGSLQFTPVSNATGTATITITVDDGQSVNATTSRVFTVTIQPVNDPPAISEVPNQSMPENSTRTMSFSISDDLTPPALLTLSITSSDTNLFPEGSLLLSGTGNDRALTAVPATNRSGVATLTLTVRDTNNTSASRQFILTVVPVNVPPRLSGLTNQSVNEDSPGITIPFVVQDADDAADTLVVTGTSSNPALVGNASIVFGGSGSNRTVTVTPWPDQNGSATINLRVIDPGGATGTGSFVLTVNAVNDLPTLSAIPAQAIDEDQVLTLALAVADKETPLESLALTASAADTNLVPGSGITFTGNGADRLLSITPGLHRSGSTTVSVVLSDGADALTNSFNLLVRAVNTPPTLDPLSNLALHGGAGPQSVNLTGISSGAPDEAQSLVVTVTSSNPALIPSPTVTYTSPNPTGTLNFTLAPNATGLAILTVTVNDGAASNNLVSRSFSVTVGAANDPPTISDVANQTTPEDTSLTVPFTIRDPDTAPYLLSVTGTSTNTTLLANTNMVFNGDGTNRFLTLNPRPDQSGTTLISLVVSDGFLSATDTFVLTVTAVNDTPTLNPLSDVTYSGNVSSQTIALSGISAGGTNENETLTVTASSSNTGNIPNPSVSYTSPNSTGSISFDPPNSANGSAVVTVTVTGSGGGSISRTFTAYIRPNNNSPPTLSGLNNQTINEDGVAGPISFTVGDSSTAAASLTVAASSSNTNLLPATGIVLGGSGANRTLTLTPAPNRSGTAAVTVSVLDSAAGFATNIIVLTVNPVNDLPSISAIPDQVLPEDGSAVVSFIASDVETISANLSLSVTSSNTTLFPAGSLVFGGSGTNRVLSLTPAPNQSGTSLLTITVSDGTGGTTNRSFRATVNDSNDPPTISAIANQTIDEDGTTGLLAFTVSDPETAPGSLSLAASSSNPALVPSASIQLGGSGTNRTATIVPAAKQTGTTTITITVTDGSGLSTNTSFLVTVQAVNAVPTLDPINNLVLNPGTGPQVVNLTGISSGATNENQPLVVAAASSNSAVVPAPRVNYTSPAATGTLVVTPNPGTNGAATITVTVNDGAASKHTITRTFTVTVRGAPRLAPIPDLVLDQDTTSSAIPLTIGDAETAAESLGVTAISSDTNLVANTNLVLGGSGPSRTLTVRPSTNQVGHGTITVTVTDGDGLTVSQNFETVVNPVNHAPTLDPLADRTVPEDSGPLVVSLTGIGSGATNEIQDLVVTARSSRPGLIPDPVVTYISPGTQGTLTLNPLPNATGTASVSVIVSDGYSPNGTVTQQFLVTIASSNDPPVLSAIGPATTLEDTPVAIGFTVSDVETPAASLTFTVRSSNPLLVPDPNIVVGGSDANRVLLVTPAPDQNGSTTIELTVKDEDGASVTNRFVLTVQPVNDPPTLNGLTSVTLQANTSSGPLPFTINDVDSDVALVTVEASSTLPSLLPPGALSLSGSGANRTITITPATNQTGTAVVTLVARDNGAASSSRSFRVTVRGSSAGPVITSQPVSRAATNGATVVFSVGASGAAPLTYQWRHDGNDIAGASGSTLTLANVQAADAGSYSAVVRNTSGSVTSAEATLRIVEAPRITALSRQSPTTVDISFTSTAGARCVVEYQDPADSTAWLALPALTGTGNVVTATDSNAISPARLYRVRVE